MTNAMISPVPGLTLSQAAAFPLVFCRIAQWREDTAKSRVIRKTRETSERTAHEAIFKRTANCACADKAKSSRQTLTDRHYRTLEYILESYVPGPVLDCAAHHSLSHRQRDRVSEVLGGERCLRHEPAPGACVRSSACHDEERARMCSGVQRNRKTQLGAPGCVHPSLPTYRPPSQRPRRDAALSAAMQTMMVLSQALPRGKAAPCSIPARPSVACISSAVSLTYRSQRAQRGAWPCPAAS